MTGPLSVDCCSATRARGSTVHVSAHPRRVEARSCESDGRGASHAKRATDNAADDVFLPVDLKRDPKRSSSVGHSPQVSLNGKQALSLTSAPLSAWRSSQGIQNWLLEWEERQRLQLQEHQQATTQLVEGLREELFGRMEDLVGKRRLGLLKESKDGVAKEGTLQEKVLRYNSEKSSNFRPVTAQNTMQNIISEQINADMDMGLMFVGGDRFLKGRQQARRAYTIESEDPPPPKPPQVRVLNCVHSQVFQAVIALFIIAYSADIGVHSTLEINKALDDSQGEVVLRWKRWTDLAFAGFFALELLIRLFAERSTFLLGSGRYWNLFDAFLVFASFVEVLEIFDFNLAFLRMLRAIRSVRVLRVIRIFRFFRELRVMATAIISCLVSLVWAFVLLLIVMYIFAVLLLQGATDYLQRNPQADPNLKNQLSTDFGSLVRTIYSLMLAVSGGRSWGELAAPYITISAWYGVVFTLFVVFVIFGVLNILTGVFVESTHSMATVDKELVIQEQIARDESIINQVRHLFHEIDVDGSGTISAKELNRNLSDPRVVACFSLLQMDVSQTQGLFQLLDKDESGEVGIEEFIFSCLRLKGNAKSIDMVTMLLESKRMYTMVKYYMHHMERILQEVRAAITVML